MSRVRERTGHSHREQAALPLTPVLRMTCARTWGEVARVYEACGDYSRACQAYERAYAKQPDADLAIAAGETAERMGDTSRALTDLGRLLMEESAGATTAPEAP